MPSPAATAPQMVSFDIFDTVLIRSVTSAEAVQVLVANRLDAKGMLPTSRDDYSAARVLAERRAGGQLSSGAPTLDKIFAELTEPFASLPGFIAAARAEEIAVEHELLRLAPGAAERVTAERNAGKRIAYVSDMHLPAAELEKALRKFHLFHDGDLLLVSCEARASKSRDGALFLTLGSQDGVTPSTTTHIGNDAWSDIKMAQKHGFATEHLDAANPNRYEQLLEEHSSATGGFSSLLAGAARETRLSTLRTSKNQPLDVTQQIQTVAADVAAPVVLGFVLWALRRCREEGVHRAYFLTRDGELPFEIANRLPAELTNGIELRMLGVGRSAISLPTAAAVDFDQWHAAGVRHESFLSQHAEELEAVAFLKRVGLEGPEHREMIERYVEIPDGTFSTEGFARWVEAMRTPEVREAILAESRRRLPEVIEYFTQEGLADQQRSAMIDVGWTGQQSAMLTALVEEAGGLSPLHLHIGKRGNNPLLHPADIEQWLFDDLETESPIANPVALFETFLVTLEESVIGYQREGESVVPLRRENQHDEALIEWGQAVLRESILTTVDHVRLDGSLAAVDADLTVVASNLLRLFWETPTFAEAKAWGAFPFEQDQLGKIVRTLALRYDLDQLRARRNGEFHGLDWKAGSVAISSPAIRLVLRAGETLRGKRQG